MYALETTAIKIMNTYIHHQKFLHVSLQSLSLTPAPTPVQRCVSYLCVRNNSTMCQLKTINIYHLSFSVGQESGHNLPGCFCLKGSPKVVTKMLTRAVASSNSVRRGRAAVNLIHMYVGRIQFLTSCWTAISHQPVLSAAYNLAAVFIREKKRNCHLFIT